MPISLLMKSAFFILILFLPISLIANTFTVVNQTGKVRSINIINYQGKQYSDFEYTSSCIVDKYKYDSSRFAFDGKLLEAIPNANFVLYTLHSQIIAEQLSSPIMVFDNRICVPIRDYIEALDSLGICKIVTSSDGFFKVDDYNILREVPAISNFSNKFNLAFFKQVYDEVNSGNKKVPNKKKLIIKSDKTLDLLKNALKEKVPEIPKSPIKKDTYYDLPHGLNRDAILKKKN